jgi:predicted DNA-binding transcriptional regulator AlpA
MSVEIRPAFIRLPEIEVMLGLVGATVYRMMAAGKFPRPVKAGSGVRGVALWRLDEVEAWVQEMTAKRGDAYRVGPVESDEAAKVYGGKGRRRKQSCAMETTA